MELNERVDNGSWLAIRGDIRRAWGVFDEDEYDDVSRELRPASPSSQFKKRYGTDQMEIIESVIDVHEALSK